MTIVLANTTTDGGSVPPGREYGISSIREQPGEFTNYRHVVTHEMGHAFGGLMDEYWPGWGIDAPNMTNNSNPAMVKWSSWVGFDGIGVHPYSNGQNPEASRWFFPSRSRPKMGMNE